jgi:hypothetical protein
MSIIPVTLEAGIGELRSEANLDTSLRPYLKNKLKAKRLGAWLK